MGILRPALVLTAVLSLAASASAGSPEVVDDLDDFVSHSTLKANSEGLIQEAFGVLPNSSLNGTLNRISALNQRGPIRSIREDGGLGFGEEAPANYVRGMEAALSDLGEDIGAAIQSFEDGEWNCQVVHDAMPTDGSMDCREAMFIILQAVKHVALDGDAGINPSDFYVVCENSETGERCYPEGHRDLDLATNGVIDAGWFDLVDELLIERGATGPAPAFGGKEAVDLQQQTDQMIERATGVEEIQYERLTGVESIDD